MTPAIPTPTEQALQKIVAVKLRCAPEAVPLDEPLLEKLELDSFDLMEVVLQIEAAFDPVVISDKSAEELSTLREIATYIDAQTPA